MIKRLRIFLGPRRFRALIALLAATGFASLALNVLGRGSELATALQTLLLVVFLLGASYLFLSRLPAAERLRWLAIIVPSVLAIVIGSLILPHLTGLFVGAGLGWIVAGIFIFGDARGPQNYRAAVKAMRKGDYAAAIASMTAEVQNDPKQPEHYRFRAELHRLAGDLSSARADYQRMVDLDGRSAVAYNGLAEVELQARRFEAARLAALEAHELAPDEWVAAYNLGMIEERLRQDEMAEASSERRARIGHTRFSTSAPGASILVAHSPAPGEPGSGGRRAVRAQTRASGIGRVAGDHER